VAGVALGKWKSLNNHPKAPAMNMTRQDFTDAFTPLILALHEKKVLDISETAHQYEDVLMRRKLDRGDSAQDLEFLEWMTTRLHRLAVVTKNQPT
jgi:SPX domain protein involved in polyphosphate accumulation